jgi:hypothetical protein
MRNFGRTALRTILAFAALSLILSVIAPPVAINSPYVSALSVIGPGVALAASCPNKACSVGGPCFSDPGSRCFKSGGQCFSRGC